MRSSDFYDVWMAGEPAPEKLKERFAEAMYFFKMGHRWYDVRIVDTNDKEWTGVYMAMESSDGNDAMFAVNQWLVDMELPRKGAFVAATIIHEVLEMYLYPMTRSIQGLEAEVQVAIHSTMHYLLDRLAWDLVPHVYPNLDPEEDPTKGDPE